ncbi:BTAD domain-containing putative transcriptional regulator, partial [Microbacterium sp.]|uniref:BTAD domain-containing putative transcriptional regulator n=1 Tax=Microbacterium sp. TaxID=51671 RepID=UPI003C72B2EA
MTASPDLAVLPRAVAVLGQVTIAGLPVRGRLATLLSLLVAAGGRTVPADRIVLELWPDAAPRSATTSLHVYVSRLRRLLADTGVALLTRYPGYAIEADPSEIDLAQFIAAADSARHSADAEDWRRAVGFAEQCRSLWRGDPFGGALLGPELAESAERLEATRLELMEVEAAGLIESGRAVDAERVTAELLDHDALNERRWLLRMRAEHAAGNTASALATFEKLRALLSEELGVDPGPALREFHERLLRSDATATDDRPPSPIGRDAERAAIDFAIRSAAAGAGRLVILRGEAGIGKSVLAEYAVAAAERQHLRTSAAGAMEGSGTPALWVWENLLATLAGRIDGGEIVQSLLARLPAEQSASDERSFRLAQAIAHTVIAHAERRPVLLVLDDLQWADHDALQVLMVLAHAIARRPVSIVALARTGQPADSPLGLTLARLARLPHSEAFELAPFGVDETTQLLPAGATPIAVHQLLEWTGGNPYFLSQLMRESRSTPRRIPASVLQLLGSRLQELPGETRDVVELLAVAGRTARPGLLASAAGVSLAEVTRRVQPAADAGLVAVPDDEWRFTHDLAREAVLAQLSEDDRVAQHGRIADGMALRDPERLHDPELYAEQRYLGAGGVPSRAAFEACTTAADHAASVLAYTRAAVHRERALAMLDPRPDTLRERFATLVALAEELRLGGDVVAASGAVQRAVELAQAADATDLLMTAVSLYGGVTLWNWRQFEEVHEPTVATIRSLLAQLPGGVDDSADAAPRAQLLGTLAVEEYYAVDRFWGGEQAAEAVRLARGTGDPALLSRVLNNFVIATWFPGQDAARLRALDESLGLSGAGLPLATEAVARMHRASIRLRLADIEGYEDDLERATWLVPRLLRDELDGQLTAQRAGHAVLLGEAELALELIDEAHARLRNTTLWGSDWMRLVVRASVFRQDGRLGELADDLVARATA